MKLRLDPFSPTGVSLVSENRKVVSISGNSGGATGPQGPPGPAGEVSKSLAIAMAVAL